MDDQTNNEKKTQLRSTGFLKRQSYQFKFTDLFEVIFAHILLNKIDDVKSTTAIDLTLKMPDIFAVFDPNDLRNKKVLVKERMQEMIADTLRHLLQIDFFQPKEEEIDVIDFYNDRISNSLNFLLNGDGSGLEACFESLETIKEDSGFNTYRITLIPQKFLGIHTQNVLRLFEINSTFYQKIKGEGNELSPYVTYEKQLSFLLVALEVRVQKTGEKSFDFNIKEAPFRHIVTTSDNDEEQLTLPSAFSLNAGQRIALPLLLEINGIIDIESIRIITPPSEIDNIDIVLTINKPAIKNRFLSDSYALSANQRSKMSSSELQLYESLYLTLSRSYIFGGRKDIETGFSRFTSWMLRKMTFCLEEPSFLRDKAVDWLEINSKKKYTQMEDEFFLPFLYEKLVDEFSSAVIKKPEKFGGEIDILFDGIPVELKVNKGKNKNLIDEIIDEKYRPASQAATYASITRLGFVVVLDLPDATAPSVTNLANCCKIITKKFDDSPLDTMIVVLIFYCNLPKPSLAK